MPVQSSILSSRWQFIIPSQQHCLTTCGASFNSTQLILGLSMDGSDVMVLILSSTSQLPAYLHCTHGSCAIALICVNACELSCPAILLPLLALKYSYLKVSLFTVLGVTLHSTLSLNKHTSSICQPMYAHPALTEHIAAVIVYILVPSYGTPVMIEQVCFFFIPDTNQASKCQCHIPKRHSSHSRNGITAFR